MTYVPPTSDELFVRIAEQREKCLALHEACSSAFQKMVAARQEHEFMVAACRSADRDADDLHHAFKESIAREARDRLKEAGL